MVTVTVIKPKGLDWCNTYLIESNGEYAVVDPSVDYGYSCSIHPEITGKIKYVLLTHGHFDHFVKLESWAEVCQNVMIGADDAPALSDCMLNFAYDAYGVERAYTGHYTCLTSTTTLELGGEKIDVIPCPGHTRGGVTYRIADNLIVGDTVFSGGSRGRTDLPGGDTEQLLETIHSLTAINENLNVYPGHGEATDLNEIRKYFA